MDLIAQLLIGTFVLNLSCGFNALALLIKSFKFSSWYITCFLTLAKDPCIEVGYLCEVFITMKSRITVAQQMTWYILFKSPKCSACLRDDLSLKWKKNN